MIDEKVHNAFQEFLKPWEEYVESILPVDSWMIHKRSREYVKVTSIRFDMPNEFFNASFTVNSWNNMPTNFDYFMSEFDFADQKNCKALDECFELIEDLRKSWVIKEFFNFQMFEYHIVLDSNHHGFFNNNEPKEYSYGQTDDLIRDLKECVIGDLAI